MQLARSHPMRPSYTSMIHRCYNPDDKQFADYGGRGIKVCDRWRTRQPNAQGFWNFLEDMGERPKGSTLDRVESDGDYSPENCRWSTRAEQQRNRRNNVMITFDGKTQCAKDWADQIGIADTTIIRRLNRGLPIEIVLSNKRWQRRF